MIETAFKFKIYSSHCYCLITLVYYGMQAHMTRDCLTYRLSVALGDWHYVNFSTTYGTFALKVSSILFVTILYSSVYCNENLQLNTILVLKNATKSLSTSSTSYSFLSVFGTFLRIWEGHISSYSFECLGIL